eukprot:288033_1
MINIILTATVILIPHIFADTGYDMVTDDFYVVTDDFRIMHSFSESTQYNALKYCLTTFGTGLATIDTPEKQAQLAYIIPFGWYWVGLKRIGDNVWQWEDGTDANDTKWYQNYVRNDCDYACVNYFSGKISPHYLLKDGLKDNSCNGTVQAVICNKARRFEYIGIPGACMETGGARALEECPIDTYLGIHYKKTGLTQGQCEQEALALSEVVAYSSNDVECWVYANGNTFTGTGWSGPSGESTNNPVGCPYPLQADYKCYMLSFQILPLVAVDYEVSIWSDFDECTEPCGGGEQTRTRTIIVEPNSARQCPQRSETQSCNNDPCVTDDFYIVMKEMRIGHDDATKYCQTTFGTGLATIDTPEKQAQLDGNIRHEWYWIGLKKIGDNVWQWEDGTDVNYTKLRSPEPWEHEYSTEDCVMYYPDVRFEWRPQRCSHESAFLICNKDLITTHCEMSGWNDVGQCSKLCGNGQQEQERSILVEPDTRGTACGAITQFVDCNEDECCPNGIGTFDWDDLTGKGEGIPTFSVPVFEINENDLSLSVVVELEYLGKASANNERQPHFGTTYVLDFDDYDAHKDKIDEPGTCQNREAGSFTNVEFKEFWNYSEEPQNSGGIGSNSFLAYPPPPNDKWQMYMKNNTCNTVVYEGHFTWQELRDCKSYGGGESYTKVYNIPENNWLNLTGIFYINVVSPVWYGNQDLGFYRVYQLLSQPFVIAVSSTVHVLGSTGINLMTMSVIAVYKEDFATDFKLILMTETAEYLELTRGVNNEIFEFTDPNNINTNAQVFDSIFSVSDSTENNGCLANSKGYICSQLWKIEALNPGCVPNVVGTDLSGTYSLGFTPQCIEDNDTICSDWLNNHPDTEDGVILSADLAWKDSICDPIIFKVEFSAEMLFYKDINFVDGTNVNTDSYLYEVGQDTIYVEIRTDFHDPTLTIFNAELNSVWICTFAPNIEVPTKFTDGQTMGCFNGQRDTDNDEYFYQIFPIPNEDFVNFQQHTDGFTNIVRFSFDVPQEVARDTLYIHAQIEVELQEEGRRRQRMLLDVNTANQIQHFGHEIGVINPNKNKPKPKQFPQQPVNNLPNPSSTPWMIIIAGALLVIILLFGVCLMFYLKCCKSKDGYSKVKHTDSEFDSEAQMIDNQSSN